MKKVINIDWQPYVDGWYDALNDAHNHNLDMVGQYQYVEAINEEDYE
jgi:hypothetical protein